MSIRGNWEKRRVETVSFLGEIDRRTFVTQDGQPGAQPTATILESNPDQLPDIIGTGSRRSRGPSSTGSKPEFRAQA